MNRGNEWNVWLHPSNSELVNGYNGLWGIENENGRLVEPHIWRSIRKGWNHYIVSDNTGQFGAISSKGKLLFQCEWEQVEDLPNIPWFMIRGNDGLLQLINPYTGEKTDGKYRNIKHNGYIISVEGDDGRFGAYDWKMIQITPCQWLHIEPIYDEYIDEACGVMVENHEHLYGILDCHGNGLLPIKYKSMQELESVMADVHPQTHIATPRNMIISNA